MNIYTHDSFTGVWMGGAAVVVAKDRETALAKLNADLRAVGLPGDASDEDLEVLIPDEHFPVCRILFDGDY